MRCSDCEYEDGDATVTRHRLPPGPCQQIPDWASASQQVSPQPTGRLPRTRHDLPRSSPPHTPSPPPSSGASYYVPSEVHIIFNRTLRFCVVRTV